MLEFYGWKDTFQVFYIDPNYEKRIGYIQRNKDGVFDYRGLGISAETSIHLRQIADKLDELNGVKNDKQS